jgi:uncharacterized membrane protein SirB2
MFYFILGNILLNLKSTQSDLLRFVFFVVVIIAVNGIILL